MQWILLGALAFGAAQEPPRAPDERALSAFSDDKSRRFDFWIGSWDVNLRMVQDDGSFQDSVQSRANIYSILNGKAILELWDSVPIKGYSLRYYDPSSDQWVLWLNWPSENRSRTSSLKGGFRHGRGDFFSEREREDGSVLRARYSFNDITPSSLRWDDHFSTDGGKTWRPNWIMEFRRTAIDPQWPIFRDRTPTFSDGQRCTLESFRDYERLAGEWSGDVDGKAAQMSVYRILDGCALVAFVSAGSAERFGFLTFDTYEQFWETDWLSSEPGSALERFRGEDSWKELTAVGPHSQFHWELNGDEMLYEISRDGLEEVGTFRRK